MKTAILLHGTNGSDKDYFWFKDTKKHLENNGYSVRWPLLPHTERPHLQETVNFIESHMPKTNEDTIIIGHSSACPAILYLLQSVKPHIKQAVLVAGFYQLIDDEGFSDLMLPKEGFDTTAIKQSAQEIVFINSDDDPWGCNDTQARPIAAQLKAKFILAKAQGHMGSNAFRQPYRVFKELKQTLAV